MMILLLKFTRSIRTAFVIQVLIFGATHIKGFDLWAFVDAFSVLIMAIGFSYAAYKTRLLLAGIIFHYFHDAFLFFVQTPGTGTSSTNELLIFYGFLWAMIGIGCLVTKLAADRFGVRGHIDIYRVDQEFI